MLCILYIFILILLSFTISCILRFFFSFLLFYTCKNWSEEIISHTRHIFCWEAMTAIKQLTVDLFKMSAHSFMVCSSIGMVFVARVFVACIQTHTQLVCRR